MVFLCFDLLQLLELPPLFNNCYTEISEKQPTQLTWMDAENWTWKEPQHTEEKVAFYLFNLLLSWVKMMLQFSAVAILSSSS